jgi:hypothetical protein
MFLYEELKMNLKHSLLAASVTGVGVESRPKFKYTHTAPVIGLRCSSGYITVDLAMLFQVGRCSDVRYKCPEVV